MRRVNRALFIPIVAATALIAFGFEPALAVEQNGGPTKPPAQTKPPLKRPSSVTKSGCFAMNGTIVTVSDDRCGASRAYCKGADGTVACIADKE